MQCGPGGCFGLGGCGGAFFFLRLGVAFEV